MLEDFRKFISRGSVIDLAVGVIIGASFTAIINSLVEDIFMPVIGMLPLISIGVGVESCSAA